jgi:NAD+ kinase
MAGGAAQVPSRIGLVVHPSRAIDRPFEILHQWALARDSELVQVPAPCQQQHVAPPGAAADCDLIVSIGGDGTTLAAIHVGADVKRPVLGVTFGSLGALTAVSPGEIDTALDRFSAGDWIEQPLPALELARDDGHPLLAINDIAVVRDGQGQLRISAEVDGTRYARFAGDGCIVSRLSEYRCRLAGLRHFPYGSKFRWV